MQDDLNIDANVLLNPNTLIKYVTLLLLTYSLRNSGKYFAYGPSEMSPDGQGQEDDSTALSSSKEAITGNFLMRFSLCNIGFILLKECVCPS
jgi:hypothetical protein